MTVSDGGEAERKSWEMGGLTGWLGGINRSGKLSIFVQNLPPSAHIQHPAPTHLHGPVLVNGANVQHGVPIAVLPVRVGPIGVQQAENV